nr:PP2C family serine/threonine-protein phosphatase [Deinobacterium chartae]
MSTQLGHGSHPGRVRESNEDYHRIKSFPSPRGTLQLMAVADGMGGAVAGEKASKLAIETLTEVISGYVAAISQGREVIALERALERAFTVANRAIYAAGLDNPQLGGMGTTLTALVFFEGRGVFAHVGDSRLHLYRNGHLMQLSQDHSWVAEQVARGFLSLEDAEQHAYRNIITRALGTKPQVNVDVGVLQVNPGDVFLLSTDGLHGPVTPEDLEAELGRQGKGFDPQAAVDYWIALANQRGGPDNITAILAKVTG